MKKIMDATRRLLGGEDRSGGAADGEGGSGTSSSDSDPLAGLSAKDRRLVVRSFKHGGSSMFDMYDSDDMDDDDDDQNDEKVNRMLQRMDPGDVHYMLKRMKQKRGFGHWPQHHAPAAAPSSYQEETNPETAQENWRPPPMQEPDPEPMEVTPNQDNTDVSRLTTDAKLFSATELKTDGTRVLHYLLQMPSDVPEALLTGPSDQLAQADRTLNVVMLDGSGSMSSYWYNMKQGWNTHVAPHLYGRTLIYVFSSEVVLKREGTNVESSDFESGLTDLTGGLQTIVDHVHQCKEKYIKVFIVTDGAHNATRVQPDKVIDMMQSPDCKVCDAYVLGVGDNFPVQYSINIRSRLHNGSSNLPSLFWAKTTVTVDEEMKNIGSWLSKGVSQSLKLSVHGKLLPGTSTTKDTFHLKEWVLLGNDSDVMNTRISYGSRTALMQFAEPVEIDIPLLLNVFRQWNSVIIQIHSKKEAVPQDVIPFMDRLFQHAISRFQDPGNTSIYTRVSKSSVTTYNTEYRTLINKVKAILTTEKFQNELELADNILSTTVGGGKYETKALEKKGHTDEDFSKDANKFHTAWNEVRPRLQEIIVTPDDTCRITQTSTVKDLQDPDFPLLLENQNKFDFLKQFTISGIGVLSPIKDSVIMNPWSFGIKSMLREPYAIVSQTAMEAAASHSGTGENKEVQLVANDDSTCFNAIIPIFTPETAKIVAPIVKTRLYAMSATFALLKNPHIIDFQVHMAALGVTWVRVLHDYPEADRPEWVKHRIDCIAATASLYADRPSYQKYWEVLQNDTAQALMTESALQVEGKTLKCESLIKPMFTLYLNLTMTKTEHLQQDKLAKIIQLLLLEYVGRCLTHYGNREAKPSPFTDFFAETLADQECKKQWVQGHVAQSRDAVAGNERELLRNFYTLEKVQKAAKKSAIGELNRLKDTMIANIPIKVDKDKVMKLRNVTLAGDVSLTTLKTFAREVGLLHETIDQLFSEENIFIYTCHALQYKASKERLTIPLSDYQTYLNTVKDKVKEENLQVVGDELRKEIQDSLVNLWLDAYKDAHKEVVTPMTRDEIIVQARQCGIDVSHNTFSTVYKIYREDVGLLGNACQSQACPFYLIPDRSYNQHALVERKGVFPHTMHKSAYTCRNNNLPTTIDCITSGKLRNNKLIPIDAVEDLREKVANLQTIYREIHQ